MPRVEAAAAFDVRVQHLRLLPAGEVLRPRGAASGADDGSMLAQAPA